MSVCWGSGYTTVEKNKHLVRLVYIYSQGSFINQREVHLSTHSHCLGLQGGQFSAKNPQGAAQREWEQCVCVCACL